MGKNKVAIITGASSGIGYETAKLLVLHGYTVFGLSRRKFEMEGLTHVVCDVSKEESVKTAVKHVVDQFGKIDVLVNNAGIGISGSIENTPLEKAKELFDINFFGAFLMAKEVLPHMSANAKIINIGSVAGELPIAFQSFYSASKSAIQSFSDCLRMEVKPFTIFVSTVLPGDTKTGFTSARVKTADEGRYTARVTKSVARMEKDEQGGMTAVCVARVVVKLANKKRPAHKVVVGVQYKIFVVLAKFLPKRFVNWILAKMYA